MRKKGKLVKLLQVKRLTIRVVKQLFQSKDIISDKVKKEKTWAIRVNA
jgi:hypothetical protein